MRSAPFRSKLLAAVAVAVLLWCARAGWDYFDPGSVSNYAMQFQLRMFGAAMYEFHAANGRWPASLDDLVQTSLPLQSAVWRQTASALVFPWP